MFKIQFQLVWQHIIDLLLVVIQSEWLIIANGLKNWLGSFQNFLLDTSSLCHCAGMTDNQTASSLWNFNACRLISSWTFHLRPLLASCHMTGWTCRWPRVGWSEARTGTGTPWRWRLLDQHNFVIDLIISWPVLYKILNHHPTCPPRPPPSPSSPGSWTCGRQQQHREPGPDGQQLPDLLDDMNILQNFATVGVQDDDISICNSLGVKHWGICLMKEILKPSKCRPGMKK